MECADWQGYLLTSSGIWIPELSGGMDSWEEVWEDEEEEEEKEGECWDEEDGYLVIKYDKGGKALLLWKC